MNPSFKGERPWMGIGSEIQGIDSICRQNAIYKMLCSKPVWLASGLRSFYWSGLFLAAVLT
jgi:hypothetical protein